MEIRISSDAAVSDDRKLILFEAFARKGAVRCTIEREALEIYFWAPPNASDAQLLRCYVHGMKRIETVVVRKYLRATGEPIGVTAQDFALSYR